MKVFLLKIIVLLGLTALALKVSNRVFSVYIDLEETFALLEKEDRDVQVMIFGSSHARCSYDTRVLEAELGVISYSFNSPNQNLFTTELLLSQALKKRVPELLIIDIAQAGLITEFTEKNKQFQLYALDRLSFSAKNTKALLDNFGAPYLPYALSSTLRHNETWNSINLGAFNRPMFLGRQRDYYYGFQSANLVFSDSINIILDRYKQQRHDTINALSTRQIKLLDNLLATIEAHKIEVLFVNAPTLTFKSHLPEQRNARLVKQYLKDKGYSFLDFNFLAETSALDVSHYEDLFHLNQKGALITTKQLIAHLKEKYTLSKAELPKDHLNRYRHIDENFANAPYVQKIDSAIDGMRIKQVAMYPVMGQKYEAIFEIQDTLINDLKVRVEYILKKSDLNNYQSAARVAVGINYVNINLSEKDLINYQDKSFAVASFGFPNAIIHDLALTSTTTSQNLLSITNNAIDLNKGPIEELVFEKQLSKVFFDNLRLEKAKLSKRHGSHWLQLEFNEAIGNLDKELNIGVHLYPAEGEEHLLKNSNGDNLAFYDTIDLPLVTDQNSLTIKFFSKIKHIKKIKMFLYDRAGYKGTIGKNIWIEN